jgi:hypothetical protein
MYESKTEPGRKFGSAFRGKRFDSYHAGEQPHDTNANERATPQDTGTEERAHAVHTHVCHDHDNGKHTRTETMADGTSNTSVHSSAAEAYMRGGDEQATNVKRRNHPDQQGAESEERNYEMPDLA